MSSPHASRARRRRPPLPGLRRGALLQALAALLWLPQAGLLAVAVGRLADRRFGPDIYLLAAAFALLGVLRSLIEARGATLAFDAARAELSRLRAAALAALSRRSPLDAARPASGETASILGEQAEMVTPYLARFAPVRLRVSLVPPFILLAVLWFSWAAALVLLLAAPLIPVFMALVGWRAKAASEKQLGALGDMNAYLLDRLRGLATIRSFHAVDRAALRLRADAETLRARTMAVLRIAFLSSAVLELFSALGVAMAAVYIGFHLLGTLHFGAWGHTLTLAQGLFVLLLAPAFFEPLRDLSAVWHDRAAGEAATEALEKLAAAGATVVGEPAPAPRLDAAPAVRLRGVDFGYGDGPAVLANFDLDVEPGEHVALLAPSGFGKSTVLALIAGLAAPRAGLVSVAGRALDAETASAARARMGWVGQKPHIFSGSARFNIGLGRDDGTDGAALIERMALGHVAGMNGLIGENGAGLSGGEALRLALARAAADPSCDIILADEPTAHLDHDTAVRIAEGLVALAQGKTLIVATHDEALARRMHRAVRLDAPDAIWGRAAE